MGPAPFADEPAVDRESLLVLLVLQISRAFVIESLAGRNRAYLERLVHRLSITRWRKGS